MSSIVGDTYRIRNVQVPSLETQVAGDHYKNCNIQPVDFIHANGLTYLEGCIVKYISRHKNKNGAEDIKKAMHYCQMILDMEYKA
jgi:hypothetical protein